MKLVTHFYLALVVCVAVVLGACYGAHWYFNKLVEDIKIEPAYILETPMNKDQNEGRDRPVVTEEMIAAGAAALAAFSRDYESCADGALEIYMAMELSRQSFPSSSSDPDSTNRERNQEMTDFYKDMEMVYKPQAEKDRKDAERYRWLLDNSDKLWVADMEFIYTGLAIEEAIDAAMDEKLRAL